MSFRTGPGGRLAALAITAAVTATSLSAPAAAFTDDEKKEMGVVIREYLIANPEVLEEAITVLQAKRAGVQAEQRGKVLEVLHNSPRNMVVGNPKGDVTLVEFFDYNCGFCRRAVPDLEALLKNDPNLRVVLRELPVLGPGSEEAARVGEGVRLVAPDKYLAFHKALFAAPGPIDGAKALAAAKSVGIDADAVKAQAASPEAQAAIEENMQIAAMLGINGTPAYMVGDEPVMGAQGYETLKEAVSVARAKNAEKNAPKAQ